MKKKIASIVGISLASVMTIAACAPVPDPIPTPEPEEKTFWHIGEEQANGAFLALTDKVFREEIGDNAYLLHELYKDPEAQGFTRSEISWFTESTEPEYYEGVLDSLHAIEYDALSRKNQIDYKLLEDYCTSALVELDYTGTNFSVNGGIQQNLVVLLSEYQIYIERDIQDYLTLISETKECFEWCVEDEWNLIEGGFGLADATLAEVIEQCRLIYEEGEECVLIELGNEKIDSLEGLSESAKADYKRQNYDLVVNSYLPAYEWLETELEKMKGHGTNEGGLVGYGEAGKAYYENELRRILGYGGSIDDLYNGMKKEMENKLNELYSLAGKNMNAYNAWIDWNYYDGEYGYGLTAMTDPEEILDYFSKHLSGAFPAIVDTTYAVKYLSDAMAQVMENTLAYYVIPPIDDYLNGNITVNGAICNGSEVLMTIAHEGYPGHLYQHVYFQQTNPNPIRNLFNYSGYTEGWAKYAECEALDYYEFNQYDLVVTELFKIDSDLTYMMYALADIGVHYYGWTVEELGDFLGQSGFNEEAAQELYDVLVTVPTVYLSYGAGVYEMLSIRSYAEKLAGKKFKLKEFHQLVLDIGPCGFDLLRELVGEYYGDQA
ncbi:MAG: DUF885 domain-containing protein [Clostridia bacterium]|nr:DUF885 domain-containing protein [Clostridia bacterium]